MGRRIMADERENFIRVTHQRKPRFMVEHIEWRDCFPSTPEPYECGVALAFCNDKGNAMIFAEALANKYRLDIEYIPLVEEKNNSHKEIKG